MRRKLVLLDFDGVLHSDTSGRTGAIVQDPPVDGAVPWVHMLVARFNVAVLSARSGEPGGIEAMQAWMRQWGFPVDQIEFPVTKPPADVILDDRAITFTGTFPTMGELEGFKPWTEV